MRLSISLFGPMLVQKTEQTPIRFEYDKVRALLAYLVIEAKRPQQRESIAELLWPEQPDTVARDSLRNALAALRKALGDHTAVPPYLLITRETIQFNQAADCWVDVEQFCKLLQNCKDHRHRIEDRCRTCAAWRQEACDLAPGDFLAQLSLSHNSWFEAWATALREELRHKLLNALGWLADFHLQRGNFEMAYELAMRQIRLEAWRERAHQQVMIALVRLGDRTAAMAQHRRLRQVLEEEFGIPPTAETEQLAQQISEGLISPIPQKVERLTPSTIGRDAELEQLDQLLTAPDCRLITITGVAGIGKTHLANTAAHRFRGDFPDGAVIVSSNSVSGDELDVALVKKLRLSKSGRGKISRRVDAYLQDKFYLLVLDGLSNTFHVAHRVSALLQAAPNCVFLATARGRLNLRSEWVLPLGGLQVPSQKAVPALDNPSVRLFLERASQIRPDIRLTLTETELMALGEICVLLQGSPLKLALAADSAFDNFTDLAAQLRQNQNLSSDDCPTLPAYYRSLPT